MSGFQLRVESLSAPQRIDAYLAGILHGQFSREEIKAAIKAGTVLLNKKKTAPRTRVTVGDSIEGQVTTEKRTQLSPEAIPLAVVYEDSYLMVIDKSAGMVVHPGAGNKKGTMVHALLGRGGPLSSEGGHFRPGIVHRLDKETSGLLLVAKDNATHRALQAQFSTRTLSKTYLALVRGRVAFEEGHVDLPIGHHPKIRQKMAIVHSEIAKEALTHYKVKQRFRYATLVELKLMTGRTHQIRVHMAHLGNPVVGDARYGRPDEKAARHALHAAKIEFEHPKTGTIMKFESPLPEDFKQMLEAEQKR